MTNLPDDPRYEPLPDADPAPYDDEDDPLGYADDGADLDVDDPADIAAEPITPPRGSRRVVPPQAGYYAAPTAGSSRTAAQKPAPPVTPRRSTGYYPPTPDYPITPPAGNPVRFGRRTARDRRDSGFYLPWWSLLVMLVAVGGLVFGSLVVVGSLRGTTIADGTTPVIVVITATFTVGPPASQTPIAQKPTLTPPRALPTIAPTASLPAGNVTIGTTVQIVGVGGSGLNVRSGPGKQFTAKFLAYDGQQYTIKDGPQFASDEEWYFIIDANNPNNAGWASRRFLQGK